MNIFVQLGTFLLALRRPMGIVQSCQVRERTLWKSNYHLIREW